MKRVRCAIYTRKSSEEGLEQDFNSLHAQREACSAYVLSQASEGWSQLPDIYDDGGLSGGTLERPALRRLLADVAAGQVDIIVVYKVDRLTRSLLDFARLVEAFDKAGVSFVSITQSFNTTTSMGRLTLNMLLSFAQFEREVTAERIRDKIAASKAKGMWMGGTPPLGYRPDGRTLAIVTGHAEIIRDIFVRYLKLGTVRHLAEQLQRENVRTPVRERLSGAAYGGASFSRGQLYSILKNPIYAGHIVHKQHTYQGKHPAIIDQHQWDRVQRLLAEHVQGQRRHRAATQSLLAGRIVDGAGNPLIAAHACKPGRSGATEGKVRYRYYVSRETHHESKAGGLRIPAKEIEGLVITRIAALFDDQLALLGKINVEINPTGIPAIMQRCAELAATLKGSQRADIAALLQQVRIEAGHVEIDVDVAKLAEMLGVPVTEQTPATLSVAEHMHLTRTGHVVRIVDGSGRSCVPKAADPSLTAMLVKARAWWAELAEGNINVTVLAEREGVTRSWLCRIVRLAFLAPAVVDAILDGRLKVDASGGKFLQPDAIPVSWLEQETRYLGAVGR